LTCPEQATSGFQEIMVAVIFPVLGLCTALFLNCVRGKRHGTGERA